MIEYWEVNWVQYRPNAEDVVIGGYHVVDFENGRMVRESRTVATGQTALTAACPEGVTVWGDDEIIAVVEASTGISAQLAATPGV